MNKQERLTKIVEKASEKDVKLTKKDAEVIYESIFEVIKEEIKDEEKVRVDKFGTFSLKARDARVGRNPKSGEEIQIPASFAVGFKMAKDYKNEINK